MAYLHHVSALAAALDLPSVSGNVSIHPGPDVFGSPYAVTDAAVVSTTLATWAVAAFDAVRNGTDPAGVTVDVRNAAAAFHSERLLSVPRLAGHGLWDPISGNYRTADGWIRLHTNLRAHRAAALGVLGTAEDRDEVTAAVRNWTARELEDAVVAAGGIAAAMRTRAQWREHPQAATLAAVPLLDVRPTANGPAPGAGRFLDGIRVLDLTRVIAGPVAGRFLASFGADVLRIDPPLDDGLLVEIDTGFGKRRTSLDLRDTADRERFESLLRDADVLLTAFRPGAMAGLGYDTETVRRIRPGLVAGRLCAYGETGPWAQRRGFDSVVQVACGIAHGCGFDQERGPAALPAQALDHASGYLLAAGVIAGLVRRQRTGAGQRVTASLARTGDWLESLGVRPGRRAEPVPVDEWGEVFAERDDTEWGRIRHVRPVGTVGDRTAEWRLPPVSRGTHGAEWSGGVGT